MSGTEAEEYWTGVERPSGKNWRRAGKVLVWQRGVAGSHLDFNLRHGPASFERYPVGQALSRARWGDGRGRGCGGA